MDNSGLYSDGSLVPNRFSRNITSPTSSIPFYNNNKNSNPLQTVYNDGLLQGSNSNDYQSTENPKLKSLKKPTNDDEDLGLGESESDNESNYEDGLEDKEWEASGFVSKGLLALQTGIGSGIDKNRSHLKKFILVILFVLYNAYFVASVVYHIKNDIRWNWCDDVGFLIIITAITYWSLTYYYILKPYLAEAVTTKVYEPIGRTWNTLWSKWVVRVIFILAILGGLLTFLIIDTANNRRRLISAAGIPVFILIGVLLSKHPARIVWRHIFWGTGLQFVFGLLILRWETGKNILQCLSTKITTFLDFTVAGSDFVYGYLATGYTSEDEKVTLNSTFAFGVLSVIFFFSFVVALLYSIGVMTWVVVQIGWLLQISMGTTASESLSASANIFLGQTEAPLVVKPYIKDMTNSELHAVFTGGFATIAGTVLGAFITFGISANHLLSASFMSAPAALAFSKLIYPETKVSRTTAKKIYEASSKVKSGNMLDAASRGASQAFFLIGNIIASLIAITAFVAFLDATLNWCGNLVGFDDLTFQWLIGKLCYPIAFIIGIDTPDLDKVGRLLGVKTVVNEFVAYLDLAELAKNGEISKRSETIATYALCCFGNFSSIGIQLGGLGALAPKRRKDMAKIIWRAFIAGNAAALMTACIAGTLVNDI